MTATSSVPNHPTQLQVFLGGPVLVAIPQVTGDEAGTMLGITRGASGNEQTPYRVRVPYRLYLSETVVTFSQWEAALAHGDCKVLNDLDWGKGDRPAINVSWNQAQAYLAWLNKRFDLTGKPDAYRLPTEAEWEYACRAGNDGDFSFGRDNRLPLSTDIANFRPHTKADPNNYRARTVPVKSFAPNAFGLYEMHGNVWEWCDDCYNIDAYKSRQDPNGWLADTKVAKGIQNWRVIRGGSWNDAAENLQSACRNFADPDSAMSLYGFRIARTMR